MVMETGFAVTALISIILNLVLPEENEDEETESLAGDPVDKELEMKLETGDAGVSKDVDLENAREMGVGSVEQEGVSKA